MVCSGAGVFFLLISVGHHPPAPPPPPPPPPSSRLQTSPHSVGASSPVIPHQHASIMRGHVGTGSPDQPLQPLHIQQHVGNGQLHGGMGNVWGHAGNTHTGGATEKMMPMGSMGSMGRAVEQRVHIPQPVPSDRFVPAFQSDRFVPAFPGSPDQPLQPLHMQQPLLHPHVDSPPLPDLRLQTLVRAHTVDGLFASGVRGSGGREGVGAHADGWGTGEGGGGSSSVRRVLITHLAPPVLQPGELVPVHTAEPLVFPQNQSAAHYMAAHAAPAAPFPPAAPGAPVSSSPCTPRCAPTASGIPSPTAQPSPLMTAAQGLPQAPAARVPSGGWRGAGEGSGRAGRRATGAGALYLSGPDGTNTHQVVVTRGSAGGSATLIVQAHNLVNGDSFWRECRESVSWRGASVWPVCC